MGTPDRTLFNDRHRALGGTMVEFGGWDMPLRYPSGTIQEHLATRRSAGLFDVSHMGRFVVRGERTLPFLQHVLTNNAASLDGGMRGAQYTLIPDDAGGAVDDAYLYRFDPDEYLLVVNAANREKDLRHLSSYLPAFEGVELVDVTHDLVMLALQGPGSRDLLARVTGSAPLPEPVRNAVGVVAVEGARVKVGRTGYTGEPLGFELFLPREQGLALWDLLVDAGATPCGLGARDTLRLEAGLPLYGHEFGLDAEGNVIPLLAVPLTRVAASFSPLKGEFVGRAALARQFAASSRILRRDLSAVADLSRMVRPVAVTGRGVPREGAVVLRRGRPIGHVTSGTMVPSWVFEGEADTARPSDRHELRAVCLAYLDADVLDEDEVTVDVRGREVEAVVVPYHLRSDAPPYARPIVAQRRPGPAAPAAGAGEPPVRDLLAKAAANTEWRARRCINLIPSEMTASPMVRLLSVMDPAFRYAEHRQLEAFYDAEVFYYQGTEFIGEVERQLEEELRGFLGCRDVETRTISGQMANAAVFSAMVDYLNRDDRRREPRRIRAVMNHHIGKGGHLSAQPMGALGAYGARAPGSEGPAGGYMPGVGGQTQPSAGSAALRLIDEVRPELIVLGKSLVLHREPVAEIRAFLDAQGIDAILLYDMAHVLGLVGPHFQEPFDEGADLVTGSTHKTFFGTQRGIVAGSFEERDEGYALWRAVRSRAFPGSVSNHHLGTLLGLLMAAYEMNHFKGEYQPRVIANAKAFARALRDCGLDVAGDPSIDFTETHQVAVHVGHARGTETARRLEQNNIICNYQALPGDEGFTAAGGLRFGVSEMTRFGMAEADFAELAELVADVVLRGARVADAVADLRGRFTELRFCFGAETYRDLIDRLHGLL